MADEAEPRSEIAADFIKSNSFRVIHVNGAIGGITPNLEIAVSLYNERLAIPQRVVYAVGAEGRITGEVEAKRASRDGIVREVEVCAHMNLQAAKGLADWLNKQISDLTAARQRQGLK